MRGRHPIWPRIEEQERRRRRGGEPGTGPDREPNGNGHDDGQIRAAQFTANNSEWLEAADALGLQAATDLWGSFWALADGLPVGTAMVAVSKGTLGASGTGGYAVYYDPTSELWTLRISAGGALSGTVAAGPVLAPDTWYHVLWWIDRGNATINLRIDAGAAVSAAAGPGSSGDTGKPYIVGKLIEIVGPPPPSDVEFWNGRIDQMYVGKPPGPVAGVIGAIHTSLWNGGLGKCYEDLTPAEKTNWGLSAAWSMDELEGTRDDAHGAHDLADHNTVTYAGGKVECDPVPAVAGLAVTVLSPTELDLTWTPLPTPPDSYRMERSPNGIDGWLEIGSSAAPLYHDTGLTPSTTYHYRVRGLTNMFYGGYSNVASDTTQGIVAGNAAEFVDANAEYLACDVAVLDHTQSMWVAGWVNTPDAVQTGVAHFWLGTSWFQGLAASSAFHAWTPYNLGGGIYRQPASPNDTWHFVLIGWDASTKVLYLYVDALAPTSSGNGALTFTGGIFRLGRRNDAPPQGLFGYAGWNGRIDSVAFGVNPVGGMAAALPGIRTSLYNGGAGKAYSDLTMGEKTDWGLISFWNMEELSGPRFDSHGNCHLDDFNTVTRNTGVA